MKAVILAGGFGTRLAEYTDLIPKPMVKIGTEPILMHIMRHFAKFGVEEFVIAAGYKADEIKRFFTDYLQLREDVLINLANGTKTSLSAPSATLNWKISIVDTGLGTMTGGRLLRLKEHIGSESFFMTYGDGLSNVNLDSLVSQHKSQSTLATVTAVRPAARFGELGVDGNYVRDFKEKPQLGQGWVNGGFFVLEPAVLDLISDDSTVFEASPLEELASKRQLSAFFHEGFWQCMDTKRDKDYLESLNASGNPPWLA